MDFPPDFMFSQSSLQDYTDCPRRFELRYLMRQAWPAVEVEPLLEKENFLQQGATFHRMIHQSLLGMAVTPQAGDDLRLWWSAWQESGLRDLPPIRYPEKLLSVQVGSLPLMAKMDMIAIIPNQKALIIDWKTAHNRPRRDWLSRRLQTRLYRYLMVKAGASLNGGVAFAPEQVEMVYWFANFPDQPERLPYDSAQFAADEAYLAALIDEIREADHFPLTEDERHCRVCLYRTLCRRGSRPAELAAYFDDAPDDEESNLLLELEF